MSEVTDADCTVAAEILTGLMGSLASGITDQQKIGVAEAVARHRQRGKIEGARLMQQYILDTLCDNAGGETTWPDVFALDIPSILKGEA